MVSLRENKLNLGHLGTEGIISTVNVLQTAGWWLDAVNLLQFRAKVKQYMPDAIAHYKK